jgi:hypothetical protein
MCVFSNVFLLGQIMITDVLKVLRRAFSIMIMAPLAIQIIPASSAEVLFEENFSTKVVNSSPNPVWSWNVTSDVQNGMMVGKGDIYQVVEGEQFLSYRNSLQMDFNGRNGFCNVCGGDDVTVASISGSTACVNAPNGPHETIVYNKSNQFSTWKVTNESNGNLCFDISAPDQEPIHGIDPSVSVGDEIYLPKVCGVNGTIGGSTNRRSDCNKAINYLDNVDRSTVGYGESIARRFYLYIPNETQLPNTTMKLGYSYWQSPGQNARAVTLKLSVQRDLTLELTMPNGDKYAKSMNDSDAFFMPKDTWVYFEEVFTRESSSGANDARYQLFVSEIDKDVSRPVVEANNFTLGELVRMSIAGNWQHSNEVKGYAYFDNIKIETFTDPEMTIGPVNRPVIEN